MTNKRLIDKYSPQKLEDMIADKHHRAKHVELVKHVKNRTPVLIWGPQGCGKTTVARLVAKKLDLHLVYTNASSERTKETAQRLYHQVQRKGIIPTIMVLDEVDGFDNWSLLKKLVEKAVIPVILIANDAYKIPKEVKDLTTVIEFKMAYVQSVRKKMKELAANEGITYQQDRVSRDIRSSINAVLHEGETYNFGGPFDVTREVYEGNPENFNFKDYLIWILDNTTNMLSGADLYFGLKVIRAATRLKSKKILKLMPKGHGQPEYPNYFRMISQAKRSKKKK